MAVRTNQDPQAQTVIQAPGAILYADRDGNLGLGLTPWMTRTNAIRG